MIMIIGGACQGKREYARKNYPDRSWIDGRICTEEEVLRAQGIDHFHEYVKRRLSALLPEEAGTDSVNFSDIDFETAGEKIAEKILKKNPGLILITDEIGYGIVPIDPFDRAYRETTGRICTKLAAEASEVHRVICGIGERIK